MWGTSFPGKKRQPELHRERSNQEARQLQEGKVGEILRDKYTFANLEHPRPNSPDGGKKGTTRRLSGWIPCKRNSQVTALGEKEKKTDSKRGQRIRALYVDITRRKTKGTQLGKKGSLHASTAEKNQDGKKKLPAKEGPKVASRVDYRERKLPFVPGRNSSSL